MTTVIQTIFYTAYVVHNVFITSMGNTNQTQLRIDTANKIHSLEHSDFHQDAENLTDANSIYDKIKNIIKEPNYEAIMYMMNKFKEFFEYPFKYFINLHNNGLADTKKSAVRFAFKNMSNVMPSQKGNLSDYILGDQNTSSTQVPEVIEMTDICSIALMFPPT